MADIRESSYINDSYGGHDGAVSYRRTKNKKEL